MRFPQLEDVRGNGLRSRVRMTMLSGKSLSRTLSNQQPKLDDLCGYTFGRSISIISAQSAGMRAHAPWRSMVTT